MQTPNYNAEALLYLAWEYYSIVSLELVQAEWFDLEEFRLAWKKIPEWFEQGKPKDLLAFSLFSKSTVLFSIVEKYGGIIKQESFSSYAIELRKSFIDRKLFEMLSHYNEDDPQRLMGELRTLIEKFDDVRNSQLKEPRSSILDFMEYVCAQKENHIELRAGYADIDCMINGLHRGEILTVGARTGRGKSAFVLNIAGNLEKNLKRVLLFSTEMNTNEILGRFMAMRLGIDSTKFRRNDLSDEEMKKTRSLAESLAETKLLWICDWPSPSIAQVRSAVRQAKPDVIILDYLGLFTLPNADRYDLRVGEFMRQLKIVARAENVSVVLTSQLNRGVELREKKTPYLADLKESGNIEQESDIVVLLYDDADDPGTELNRRIIADIKKNRHGKCGGVRMVFKTPFLQIKEELIGTERAAQNE